jgi:ABC-2 type transport system permease protein
VRGAAAVMRAELIGLAGVVERNVYLTKRYFLWDVAFFVWTVANTLTIVFIAKGFEATGAVLDVDRATTSLLIGAVIWAYLGIIFEFLTETVAWERWEGTIEYTFMAPLSRAMHLAGQGVFAIIYGLARATLLFAVVAFFFDLSLPNANFLAALLVVSVASVSFIGIGMMTSVMPLIATISPATYALEGARDSIMEGAGVTEMWPHVWPLLIIGVVSVPLGLWVFSLGERYAKHHGKLKRSG